MPRPICSTICDVNNRVLHHEVQRAERFVRLVDAVNEIDHLEREVDQEGVEQ